MYIQKDITQLLHNFTQLLYNFRREILFRDFVPTRMEQRSV
jgi:hypothetical protein